MTRPAFATVCLLACMAAAVRPQDPAKPPATPISLLETHCFKCHGAEKPKGNLNLSAFKDEAAFQRDPKTLKKILSQVKEKEMPPEGKPQPKPEERDRLVAFLERALATIDYEKMARDPGRVLIHRLSRTEYDRTIRDLLGVDTRPSSKFPADGGGGAGFDNNADTLFIPPILMEKYLEAAGEVLAAAAPERLFVRTLDARATLEHHATRAFRRPVEAGEIDRLMTLFDATKKRGASFEDAVRTALKAVLVSPKFLFRIEVDQPSKDPYPIGEYEMASRLSYFLWSSMPDDELFRLAAEKKLHDPKTLEAQVKRMIRDPKARALAEGFAGQWLGVHDLRTVAQPDPRRYPNFTPELRDAMIAEGIEVFLHLLRDDASLLDLIDCGYTFVNEELAKHYKIADVRGKEMRRVELKDPTRGGVLTMAGVLTLTSYPQRTSPVLRGKWVLEELFGTPAPPPPMNVGLLGSSDRPEKGLTFRQRLEAHRQKPACGACHKKMDPVGFGLENFDATGAWRTEIAGQPVDASGVLASGEKFTGPVELKKILLRQKDQFVQHLSEKMLSYALGRGIESYDAPAVKKLTDALAGKEYKSHALITAIATGYPFQYRRNQPVQGAK